MAQSEPPRRGDLLVTTATTEPDTPRDASGGELGMLLVTGQGRLQPYRLQTDEVLIGRSPDCHVVINHPTLSRRHVCLRLSPQPSVQDLGSTNGTKVGGQVIHGGEPILLSEGDGFAIGPFSFLLARTSLTHSGTASHNGHGLLRIADPTPEHATPLLHDVAAADATVLILGETGVGKEVLADTIHQLSGRSGPLVRINCAALSESLLESELFGHEKGAFTGATGAKAGLLEAAEGGSVFLDEVGELPLSVQAKLLRALEAREVLRIGATRPIVIDARFIAATNRDLTGEVAAGRFRRDLYFRLDGISLHLPPLRERKAQILPLARDFLAAAAARTGVPVPGLDRAVETALEAHSWPGNVRELKAVVERAILLARGEEIGIKHLALTPPPPPKDVGRGGVTALPARNTPIPNPPSEPPASVAAPAPAPSGPPAPIPAELAGLTAAELAERARIIDELEACAGNQTRAARQLGMSRTTLVTRLQHYRIPRPRGR